MLLDNTGKEEKFMSFIQIIKNSIFKPTKNSNTRKMKNGQFILLIFVLIIMLFIPKFSNILEIKQIFTNDINLAQKNIPEFEIKNNQLTSNNQQGVIVNGKFISFIFDPTDKKDPKDFIKSDNNNYLMVDLTKTGIYVGINEQLEEMMPISPNPVDLSYNNLSTKTLSKNQFFKYLRSMVNNPKYIMVILGISAIMLLTSLIFNLLILTISALIYTKLSKINLKFLEIFKLCTVSSVLPTLIQVILSFFVSTSFLSPLVLIASLFIFFANIRPLNNKNNNL